MKREALFECYCPHCKKNTLHAVGTTVFPKRGVKEINQRKYLTILCTDCQLEVIFNIGNIERLKKELAQYVQMMEDFSPSEKQ